MKPFIVQSHRGGGALAPENTPESFIASWEMGAVPEADLRTTSDGIIIAFHDANLARVVKDADSELREKSVGDLSFAQLSQLDVGARWGDAFAGQRVHSIAEIFALMQGRPERMLYLDIKEVELPRLAEVVRQYDVSKQVVLAAPDERVLREWQGLLPQGQALLWMGIRGGGDESTLEGRLEKLRASGFAGVTQLQIHVEAVRDGDEWAFKPSLEFLHKVATELEERNILFQCLPWMRDEPEVYRALVEAGCRSFASDYPQVALQVLYEWAQEQPISLQEALQSARETKLLKIGQGILPEIPRIFREQFGEQAVLIVADTTTYEVAGRALAAAFSDESLPCLEPFVFTDPALHAEYKYFLELEDALRQCQAVPVAVGSGVINDLVKLAAHRVGRPYLCVPTAASMDGYTAFGASITYEGSKQTFDCPAPVAVATDLQVLAGAPLEMTAAGYADLMAKITAGADWIVADMLEVEPIDLTAWRIVQSRLRQALDAPAAIAAGESEAMASLSEGLMLGGFAMQWTKSSRPASGAEHQFSHLWDMQHHTHNGSAPSHGFKVGIGTLAVTALYEYLLEQPLDELDVEVCLARWPEASRLSGIAHETLGEELAELGTREAEAKHLSKDELRIQLERVRRVWPALKERLQSQLLSFREVEERLRIMGAPSAPEEIGITRARLRRSFRQAALIRRRFTVLDLALRTNTLDSALEHLFGPDGPWPDAESSSGESTFA